jgi:hypothetical protein
MQELLGHKDLDSHSRWYIKRGQVIRATCDAENSVERSAVKPVGLDTLPPGLHVQPWSTLCVGGFSPRRNDAGNVTGLETVYVFRAKTRLASG